MATVPYTGTQDVMPDTRAPDDYSRVQANSSEAGGLIASGLQQAGKGASTAGNYFGKVASDNASNDYQDFATKILHGDPSKTTTGPDGKPQQDLGYLGLKGRAALDARPQVEQALDEKLKSIREGLQTPEQQLDFDNFSRRYRSYVGGEVGTHADNQANTWYSEVNTATIENGKTHISANANNPKEVAAGAADIVQGYVKNAQLKGAQPGDDVFNAAIDQGKREALKAQIEAIGATDPRRALTILSKNQAIAGPYYEPLEQQFKAKADQQIGLDGAARAIVKATGAAQPIVPVGTGGSPTAGVTPELLHSAIIQQESGGRANAGTSVTGAQGIGQIEPATFAQYAKLGEHINNPADNLAVSKRIIADYYQRFGGDPQRVAVAYFSGPGNVAPAGSPTPWVRNNADPTGKTVASYVADIGQRLGGTAGRNTSLKSAAYQFAMADPDLQNNPQALQHALQKISQDYTAAQIASDQDVKAQKDANDQAANGYVTKMLTGDMKGLVDQIANDPNLTWETKRALGDAAEKASGEGVENATKTYGSGFWGAYKAVVAPAGDDARISDPAQLYQRAGPDGDLTLAGVQKLRQVMQETTKDVNGQAVNTTKVGLMNYAKSKLSFEEDTGPVKIRDPKGEALFSAQFIPKFEAAFDKWTKDGKNPWDFLTQKNVDDMIQGMRPASQMAQDRMTALGDSAPVEAPNAPLPPAPANVNPDAWTKIVSKPPAAGNGAQFSHAAWASALNMLLADPAKNIPLFNQSKFGKAGMDGADIVKQLGIK